jgi:S1-C subfamily serine protease
MESDRSVGRHPDPSGLGAEWLTVGVGTAPGAPVDQRGRAATIVGAAPCEDVAPIKVSDTAGLKTMALGSQGALSAGDPVVALGFPVTAARASASNFQNAVLIVRSGSVSSPETTYDAGAQGGTINYPNVVQTDTVINHGSSGGPLVNFNQQLVGMNSVTFNGGSANVSGENYAIGVDRIKALIPRLEHGSIGSAGFILDPGVLTDATGRGVTGLPPGIAVDAAVNGSPTAALPVKYYGGNAPPYSANNPPPTVLTSINGTQLSESKVSYCQAVGKLAPNQNTTVGLAMPGLNGHGQIEYIAEHYQVVFK